MDTDRSFQHYSDKYPFKFENYRSDDLREWVALGFEIGGHTVNHIDLGGCSIDAACGIALRAITGMPVSLFSFPFGRPGNIREDAVELTKNAGYSALFSARGGFVDEGTDVWDIPRLGVNGRFRPLYLLLEIEGLAVGQLMAKTKRIWRRPEGTWTRKTTATAVSDMEAASDNVRW